MQIAQTTRAKLSHCLLNSQVHSSGRIHSTPSPTNARNPLQLLCLGILYSPTSENTTLHVASSPIVGDICPTTALMPILCPPPQLHPICFCTQWCTPARPIIASKLSFVFLRLQHISSLLVIFAVGSLAILAASSLGCLLVAKPHYLTSYDFL